MSLNIFLFYFIGYAKGKGTFYFIILQTLRKDFRMFGVAYKLAFD